MATTNKAATHWQGSLKDGAGTTDLVTSGLASFDMKWAARAQAGRGTTNPEELLAAAHATCYSMALANKLTEDGHEPRGIDTTCEVSFQAGKGITGIKLTVKGDVPDLDPDDFKKAAVWAKDNCPVSLALGSVPKELVVN